MAAATTYAKVDEGTERSSEEGKEEEAEPANAAEDNGTEAILPEATKEKRKCEPDENEAGSKRRNSMLTEALSLRSIENQRCRAKTPEVGSIWHDGVANTSTPRVGSKGCQAKSPKVGSRWPEGVNIRKKESQGGGCQR